MSLHAGGPAPTSGERPRVSVLLPVYNAGEFLAPAVESVLQQQDVELELLALDDGSTDGSGDYLDRLDDPRVTVVHQPNAGLVATLQRGLQLASHPLVARMDADDLSRPGRLRRQAEALLADPALAAVACCFATVDDGGRRLRETHLYGDPALLRRQLYFRNVLPHGAVMMRKELALAVGGYREVGPAEDYDLWCRLSDVASIGALPEVLYDHRSNPGGVSQTGRERQLQSLASLRAQLHARSPLRLPGPLAVAREGSRLVDQQPRCPDLAASYAFDCVGLAVTLARRHRWLQAARAALGAAAFGAARPRALHGAWQLARSG
ncbi:glycosyltransferase involved in cell wall biosynthesis [Motilibacter peucedani]|uniref:Glycosyltransferase involved in cell wall biosynthesis n=1 Tax=Motilibacter peucedani TaxID=598650 RepID=A0A420XTY2_9ACTN|nr:glycosyltransferase [Motilibacter peucedani]RKS80303.1 glycosyltransferase involved in cell wall biosynthesis [Motilibacter peucedani]